LIKDIYIHIPLCSSKCLYCNFLSYRSSVKNTSIFLKGLKNEIENNKEILNPKTLYIGGGTPSILKDKDLEFFIDILSVNKLIPDNGEFTFEVNPESFKKDSILALKYISLNRISIGVQALNNKRLSFLGRAHSVNDSVNCLKYIKKINIKSISVDFIYDLPGDNPKIIEIELKKIIALSPNHISAYSLTVEKGTKLFIDRDKYSFPTEEEQIENYYKVIEVLKEYGFNQYELSNFSKSFQHRSKHNTHVWQGKDYLGFGPGSVSKIKNLRKINITTLNNYSTGNIKHKTEKLNKIQLKEEKLIVNLRRVEGMRRSFLSNENTEMLKHLEKEGFLILYKTRIKLTDKGKLLTNIIIFYLSKMI